MVNKILIGLVVVLAIAGTTLFNQWRSERENAIRWENNYNESNKVNQTIRLTISELQDRMDYKMDSILKIAKVKPSNVQNITTIHNHYHDTVYVEVPVTKIDTNKYEFIDKNNCMTIKGIVDVSLDTPKVFITEKIFDDESSYIVYQDRRKWKLLFFKTKLFGKKESKLKIINKCGDITYQNINIIKE